MICWYESHCDGTEDTSCRVSQQTIQRSATHSLMNLTFILEIHRSSLGWVIFYPDSGFLWFFLISLDKVRSRNLKAPFHVYFLHCLPFVQLYDALNFELLTIIQWTTKLVLNEDDRVDRFDALSTVSEFVMSFNFPFEYQSAISEFTP